MSILFRNRSNWVLILLSVFGIIVHWMLNLPCNGIHPEVLNGDAFDYHVAAQWLYTEGFRPHPTRMFGFPLLTGWIVLFDASFEAFYKTTYVFNAVCWIGTVGLLWWIGRRLFGAKSWLASLPAVLFGLNLGNILLISQPISETLYTCLLTAVLAFLLKDGGQLTSKWALAALGCFCFSLVVRPTGSVWLLVFIPFLLWRWWPDRRLIVGGLLILLCTIGLQTGMMYKTYGQLKTTNIGLLTHFLYLDAYAPFAAGPDTWENKGLKWYAERDRRLVAVGIGVPVWKGVHKVRDWQQLDETMRQQAITTIWNEPKGLLLAYVRSLFSNAMNGSNIALLAERVDDPRVARNGAWLFAIGSWQNRLYTLLAWILAGFLCFQAARQRDFTTRLLCWSGLFSLTVLVFSAISFAQGDRFQVATMPYTVVLLAWVVNRLLR